MLIAHDVGTTFQAGRYTVRIALRADNPAFPKYLVFLVDKFIGHQFSRPNEADCEWLERCGYKYATISRWHEISEDRPIWNAGRKRGRPRKDHPTQRAIEEALAA